MTFLTLAILGLASYRITRFLIIDSLFAGTRNKFHSFLINRAQRGGRLHLLWEKSYELSSCSWCSGWWCSLLLYSLWIETCPIYFTRQQWIFTFAITAVQSFLHALEPDDS